MKRSNGLQPPAFQYTEDYVAGPGCTVDPSEITRQGCHCQTPACHPSTCSCLATSGLAYTGDGRLLLAGEAQPILECHELCPCGDACPSRVVQKGVSAKLQVFSTEGKGWGVKTLKAIGRNQFVCEYVGELIDRKEARRRVAYQVANGFVNYIISLRESVVRLKKTRQKDEEGGMELRIEEWGDKKIGNEERGENKLRNDDNNTDFRNEKQGYTERKDNDQLHAPGRNENLEMNRENMKGRKEISGKRKVDDYLQECGELVDGDNSSNDFWMETIVDPLWIGNIARFINHSCEPNLLMLPVRVHSITPRLALFAAEDIAPDTEICFDYSGAFQNVPPALEGIIPCTSASPGASHESSMYPLKPCHCGTPSCRGVLPYDATLLV
uniref:histone-lysine N-methyltransferase SETMAR-like n=1 Tax=Myxine glutinosa TaxID=7769 RepID=UPI00358E68BA